MLLTGEQGVMTVPDGTTETQKLIIGYEETGLQAHTRPDAPTPREAKGL